MSRLPIGYLIELLSFGLDILIVYNFYLLNLEIPWQLQIKNVIKGSVDIQQSVFSAKAHQSLLKSRQYGFAVFIRHVI